jgi:hypothetical protein
MFIVKEIGIAKYRNYFMNSLGQQVGQQEPPAQPPDDDFTGAEPTENPLIFFSASL